MRPTKSSGIQTTHPAKSSEIQTTHPAEPSGTQNARLWPRVEICRAFVLSELHRFLLIGLCRVEMRRNAQSRLAGRARERRITCQVSKSLMCILAPVRNFSVVCFERVTSISVCGSEPVRNGLNRPCICDEFRLRGLSCWHMVGQRQRRADGGLLWRASRHSHFGNLCLNAQALPYFYCLLACPWPWPYSFLVGC
jgi:hypothetical protein